MPRGSSEYPERLFLDHLRSTQGRKSASLNGKHLVLHAHLHLCFLKRLSGRTEDNVVIL